jgi:murein DD-endopeptidase MepM/ murein hydrolase activator NlpD
MGNMLRIDHGNGISTYYGHLSKITVKNGARVTRGQVIGQIGNSGRSTGPHLHYGVRLNGVYVNPRKYLF